MSLDTQESPDQVASEELEIQQLDEGVIQAAYIPDFKVDDMILYFSPSLENPKEVYHDLPDKARDRWGGYFTKKGYKFLSDPSGRPPIEGPFQVKPGKMRIEILEPGKIFSPKPCFKKTASSEGIPIMSLEKKRPFDQWKPTYIKSHGFMKRFEAPHAVPRAVDYALWEVEESAEIPGSVSWENAEQILLEYAQGNSQVQEVLGELFEKRSEEFSLGSEVYLRVLGKADEEGLKKVCDYHNYPMTTKRSQVAKALAQLGDQRSLDALLVLLEDEEPEVRTTALKALGSAGVPSDHRAAEILREFQNSEEITERVWATEALYRGGDEDQYKELVKMIKEVDLPLMDMGELGQTLVALKLYSTVPFIIKRTRHERPEIRDDAAEVLRELTGLDPEFYGSDTLEKRRKAVKVWDRWWSDYKKQRKQEAKKG